MSFITGNGFKNFAHYIFDEHGFRKHKPIDNEIPIFFVKTDYIDIFFNNNSLLPNYKFKLITHNSDYSIGYKHINYINNTNLEKWFAQNVEYEHEKLIPIPIGIANSEWPHGDISVLQKVIDQKHDKQNIMYANFNIRTNPNQRKHCLANIPSEFVDNNVPFETYLDKTAKSYFTICPLGNGIDSHRIWESLYLKSIPVVENTYNVTYMSKKYQLPVILIEDWSHFPYLQLEINLYQKMIENFDPFSLTIPRIIYEKI
jgi:hypothetical protein